VVVRRVGVDDQVDVGDVDAARGDVGRHEHPRVPAGEGVQRALALPLRAVAVDGLCVDADPAELLHQTVRAVLGAHEEQGAGRSGEDLAEDVDLVLQRHDERAVLHRRHVRLRGVDGARDRVGEVVTDQLTHGTVQRRREEHPLGGGRGHVQEAADVGEEAHVGHVVGLVEDADLDLVEAARAPLDQVQQPSGGGDDQVDAALEGGDLAAHRRAAVDGDRLDADGVTERLESVAHLHGELTGRHQDEPARRPGLRAVAAQAGEHRQAEGERLARAGLGPAEHVAPGQRVGQGGGLDREGGADLAALERRDQLLRKAELGE